MAGEGHSIRIQVHVASNGSCDHSKHGRDAVLDGELFRSLRADELPIDNLNLHQHMVQREQKGLVLCKIGRHRIWQSALHFELRTRRSNHA